MQNENYKLTFEKYFRSSADLEGWEIMDFSESFINNNPVTGIVPTHVDDGEKFEFNGGAVRYKKENLCVKDNCLVLGADKDLNGFTGAMIKCTCRRFGKGYLEIKGKFPAFSKGIWPKMTLKNKDKNVVSEIDFAQIMGIRGKNACSLIATYFDGESFNCVNYLYSAKNLWPRYYPPIESPELFGEGFHIFGFERTDSDLAFSVDGIEFSRIDLLALAFAPFRAESELYLSVSAGLPRIELPDENTTVPCDMQVEYIKFYEEVK